MEALAEQHVAIYLTRGGKVFIAPQYSVLGDKPDSEWSCPDFVVLSFEKPQSPEVIIVEVTTASDPSNLVKKVSDRKAQWFDRVSAKLKADGITNNWPIRFLGFVRREALDKARQAFTDQKDVYFLALEDTTFSWCYWENRKSGLPG